MLKVQPAFNLFQVQARGKLNFLDEPDRATAHAKVGVEAGEEKIRLEQVRICLIFLIAL